jgi:hypothetical protein
MTQPVSRRTFLGATGLAAAAMIYPNQCAAHDGKDGALRDTAYLYPSPA